MYTGQPVAHSNAISPAGALNLSFVSIKSQCLLNFIRLLSWLHPNTIKIEIIIDEIGLNKMQNYAKLLRNRSNSITYEFSTWCIDMTKVYAVSTSTSPHTHNPQKLFTLAAGWNRIGETFQVVPLLFR